jgi:hypothetical protein
MKTAIQWKFLELVDGEIKSVYGDCTWKIGKWQKPIKDLDMCNTGYHSSATIPEAYACVRGDILAQVECQCPCIRKDIKFVWENMRIVKAYRITLAAIDKYFLRALEVSLKDNPEQENAKEIAEAIEGMKQGVVRSNYWSASSSAGVWCVNLYYYRANSSNYVSFRCACDRLQQVWAEFLLPTLEEVK